MTRGFRTALLLTIALFVTAAAQAPDKSNAGIHQLFIDASQQVFAATGSIFTCLSEGRKGKATAPSNLFAAKNALNAARSAYKLIESNRAKTKLLLPDDKQIQLLVSGYSANRKKGPLNFEGDVAQANSDAITDLLDQIDKWPNCAPPLTEFLRFIENKINLERASQIAEIVFTK